jgi:hypothetical protein
VPPRRITSWEPRASYGPRRRSAAVAALVRYLACLARAARRVAVPGGGEQPQIRSSPVRPPLSGYDQSRMALRGRMRAPPYRLPAVAYGLRHAERHSPWIARRRASCIAQLNRQSQVGPIRLLADPDCVVCGLLAHIPASSRVPPALPYHRGPPINGRAQSPGLPRPAADDRHLAKMLIRPSFSSHMVTLACRIAEPGQP